uniref:SANT domain-containing protein n=1 Tax=Aegilops tauschii subsp. strangulata TaxID=200361 RepID=A0A453STR3_AEGTS
MDSVELEDSGEHQPSLEVSLASDVIYDDAPVCPCIGSDHQAEIPNLSTEDERQQLMTSSPGGVLPGFDYPVTIGLAIPVIWGPSEVRKEEELGRHHSSETKARAISQDEDRPVTSVCPTSNDMSDHDSTYQDPQPMVPVDHVESGSNRAHAENLAPCSTQEGHNFTNKPMTQEGEIDQFIPLPCASTSLWSGIEAECFLLGLYIFGKNLSLLSRFLGNKTIGDVLSYYYGKFYKRDAYRRWSDCRKARTRRCILGERIFTSWRQQEIISRLKSVILNEAHDSLLEIFKSFNDGQTSLEDFVFALKSTVGTEALVEAVGIGKEKRDLTGFVLDPSKPNQVPNHPDMPTGKDCSSLASEEIIKFLTGDFRRSKTRSNDLFWEAVWPRLLARGWHSEQPKDVSTTKNSLVFLVPGIKKFSRSKLTKGTHYFDSVSDVLKRVAADPILLDLEVGGLANDITAEENGYDTDVKNNQDDPLDGNQELPRFTIIDTTLVQGQEPFRIREMRRLPADAKVRSVPSRQSRKVVTVSSSEGSDADGRLSDDQEYRGPVTTDVNDTEIFSVRNVKKETQVDSLQNMVTASCSDFPVNGHSSNGSGNEIDLTCLFEPKTKTERRKYLSPVSKRRKLSSCNNDQTSRRSFPFSKGVGSTKEKIKPLSTSSKPTVGDVSGNSQIKEKIKPLSTSSKPTVGDVSGNSQIKEKIKPLSTPSKPTVGDVSGNSQIKEKIKPLPTSSKPTVGNVSGNSQIKEKIKPLPTSSKPIVGDVSGNSQIKTVARCSTEKPREQVRGASNTLTNDRSSEKMKVKNLYEDKSFERKVDALPEVHSKITIGETKFAKGAQASSSVGQVKQETPLDSMTGAIVCVTLSDDDDYMMAEEAPSISSSDQVRDPEVAERPMAMVQPASSQADLAPQADSRRHGTRNRPPTAKALEALALGLIGKRKGEPKSPGTRRPPQRARKSSKKSVHTPTGSDTDKSSMDADAQL